MNSLTHMPPGSRQAGTFEHTVGLEEGAWQCQLIHALITYKHLPHGFILVGSLPGLLDSLDMFIFSDGWADAIGGTVLSDEMYVVSKWMLSRKIKVVMKAYILEDVTVEVKLVKCFLSSSERSGIMEVSAHEITEVKESGHASNHINWYEALNGR